MGESQDMKRLTAKRKAEIVIDISKEKRQLQKCRENMI